MLSNATFSLANAIKTNIMIQVNVGILTDCSAHTEIINKTYRYVCTET